MNLAIGISTLNDGIYRVKDNIKEIQVEYTVIIIHQITNGLCYEDVKEANDNTNIVTLFDSGLSKSRNALINKAYELGIDYLIISDDDVLYLKNGLTELKNHIHKDNSVSHFQIRSCTIDGELRKKYPNYQKKIRRMDVFGVSSIEMCLNIKRIMQKNIKFDERFGLGSIYPAGEEPIFISDMLKSGEDVFFIPITVTVHPIESSGLNIFYNDWALMSRGVIFVRCLGRVVGVAFAIAFWGKKFCSNSNKKNKKITKLNALRLLIKGCFYI